MLKKLFETFWLQVEYSIFVRTANIYPIPHVTCAPRQLPLFVCTEVMSSLCVHYVQSPLEVLLSYSTSSALLREIGFSLATFLYALFSVSTTTMRFHHYETKAIVIVQKVQLSKSKSAEPM